MNDLPGNDNTRDDANPRPESIRPWQDQIAEMRQTRRSQFLRLSRKMLNHLCSIGLSSAQKMLTEFDDAASPDANIPGTRLNLEDSPLLSGAPFELAAEFLGDDEINERLKALGYLADD